MQLSKQPFTVSHQLICFLAVALLQSICDVADCKNNLTGAKVFFAAAMVTIGVLLGPRLAVLSVVGAERAVVATLLTFEQAIIAAGLTLLRWVRLDSLLFSSRDTADV